MRHTLTTLPTEELADALVADLTKNTGARCQIIPTIAGWKVVYDDQNRVITDLDSKQNFVKGWQLAASRFAAKK